MNNFYIGEGSDNTGVVTKMMTVNASLRISVYNPATFYGIHVTSTPINLIYSDIVVASGQVFSLHISFIFWVRISLLLFCLFA